LTKSFYHSWVKHKKVKHYVAEVPPKATIRCHILTIFGYFLSKTLIKSIKIKANDKIDIKEHTKILQKLIVKVEKQASICCCC